MKSFEHEDLTVEFGMRGRIAWIARWTAVAILIAIGVTCAARPNWFLPTFVAWMDSVRGLGIWTDLILFACYLVAALVSIPVTFITPGVGFLLGPVEGFLVAILGCTVGTALNFCIGRTLLRQTFERWARQSHRLRALEIACRTRGFRVVALARLTPIFPMAPTSYFFGITSVAFWRFVLGTTVGMAPRLSLGIMIGATAKSLEESAVDPSHPQSVWLVGLILGVTLIAVLLIVRIAHRALQEELNHAESTLPPAMEHDSA